MPTEILVLHYPALRYCVTILSIFAFGANAVEAQWSHWRGPTQNGVAYDTGLPEKWSPNPATEGNNLRWKAPFGSRTTPIIQNGRAYFIGRHGEGVHEQERVVCLDADTGKFVAEHRFNVFHTDIVSVRLGWTTVCGDPKTGNIYAHGTQGLLFCFDKDLKVVWQKSLTEEFGRVSGYGGRVTSPIIDGNLLILGIINASWGEQAIGNNRFMAIHKNSGQIVWWSSTGFAVRDTYYSTPVVAVINGERLMITGGGDGGVHAFKVLTGERVWSHLFGPGSINWSPVVSGNLVYIGQGEENDGASTQGAVLCLDASQVKNMQPKLVWQKDGIKAKFASPIIHEDRLYICGDVGTLHCLDGKTGKEYWDFQYGKNTKGSPVLADGKIYLAEVNSKFHILKPGVDSCERLHAQFFRKTGSGEDIEINGSPAIANGRVYFMTGTDFYCLETKDGKIGNVPEQPGIPTGTGAVTHIQIYPADLMVEAMDKVKLSAWGYDSKGHLIGPVEVKWELAGLLPPVPPRNAPPAATKTGPAPATTPPPLLAATLSAAFGSTTDLSLKGQPPAQFGRVIASSGMVSGYARVRVVPKLPYAPNFANIPLKRTPGGWVNCQGKFEIVQLDDKKFLKKVNINPSPLVARANAYINPPSSTGYTIESDVMGTKVRDDLPDMGVVANRYTLMLAGNTQQLRLVSWDALPRVDKTISFPWKAGVWYRLKLTVEVGEGGKGIAKGKAWPKDQKEPAEWNVDFSDPIVNANGSAAIYGYAAGILDNQPGCEIFYDRVTINPNK